LNSKLAIKWVAVNTQNRFDAVASGLADMECGSSTVSFGRMAKVDFSSYIFMENTGLMVRADSGIFSVRDMKRQENRRDRRHDQRVRADKGIAATAASNDADPG
jgi:ABC-type amino acid transport substrate-binding protein